MLPTWLRPLRKHLLWAGAALIATAGVSRADDTAELRALLQAQQKQIQELNQKLNAMQTQPVAADGAAAKPAPEVSEAAVKKIVGEYLKENPGAGMPTGVQTGYST